MMPLIICSFLDLSLVFLLKWSFNSVGNSYCYILRTAQEKGFVTKLLHFAIPYGWIELRSGGFILEEQLTP